jgi:membrane AbrB-like protein
MEPPANSSADGWLGRLPRPAQWLVLVVISLLLAGIFEIAGLPAAFLLGPMLAGIFAGTNGSVIRLHRAPVIGGQIIVGCLMGHVLTADIVQSFARDWPLFLGVVLVIIITSGLLGWMISRLGVLPGTTAVWGVAPGAASAMMIMSASFGADMRLVALMQYLRVVCVAGLASIVARIWVGPVGAAEHGLSWWFPAVLWTDFAITLAIGAAAGAVGILLKFPAGALFFPLFATALLQGTGLVTIVLPPWLLAASYAALGWSVGLAFTRDIVRHAWRALPQILLSIAILIAVSAVLAFILVEAAGIDPLTAYLATTPGGMDTMAIIGAASKVDLSFVMALQTVRFMIVFLVGPPLARFIARRVG